MDTDDLLNLPQRLAEKHGAGEAVVMRGRQASPNKVFEIHKEGQVIGYISWSTGRH